MTETVTTRRPEVEQVGPSYGLATAIIGAVLVLVDGIATLAMKSVFAPSLGGVTVVGVSEIVLSLLALIAVYFYKSHSTAAAWTIGILAFVAFFFDGGFYYVGAALAVIGAIIIYFRK